MHMWCQALKFCLQELYLTIIHMYQTACQSIGY